MPPAARPTSSDPIAPSDVATLVLLAALWGGAYLFSRVAVPEVGPLWVGVARAGIAAVLLLALTGRPALRAVAARPRPFLLVALTSSAIPFTLIAVAATTLPTALGGILNATTPLFTALFSVALLGQRLTTRTVIGLAVGISAVLVLVGSSPLAIGPTTFVAIGAALGAAGSFGIAGVYTRKVMSDVPPMHLATGQMLVASAALVPLAGLGGVPSLPSQDALVALAGVGIGSTAIAWPLYFRVLRRSSATMASTVTFIIPGFAILWGALFLGERLGSETVAGFALVVVSLALVLGIRLPRPTLPSRGVPVLPTPAVAVAEA